MKNKLILAGIAMLAIAISACDDDTSALGDSLTSDIDKFLSVSQSYNVIESKSIQSNAVLATSQYRYLGKIKDPETNSYISCDYMTQFNVLENEYQTLFPDEDMMAHTENGKPVADSCVVRILINSFQGDSLAAMRLQLCELDKPVPNGTSYYTDFDPEAQGYLRTDANAIRQNKLYSVSDLTMTDSLRNVLRGSGYYQYITIPLNKEYTDKSGNSYKNYGTYLLQKWYENNALYKNSNTFARNVCPGFYVKTTGGENCMMEVANTQIIVYYTYTSDDEEVSSSRILTSTAEVLQTTHIVNDQSKISTLVNDSTRCTYLKTPAGIFTEVALPIDSIIWLKKPDSNGNLVSHENDTIISARITFQAKRSQSELSDKVLKAPSSLLMLQKDKLGTFFQNNNTPDNLTSYIATYNSTQKTYSFNTITSLINYIYYSMKPEITNADGSINLDKVKTYTDAHPNWNKVVLVPVSISSSTTSSSTLVTAVTNSLNISSVRLVGGTYYDGSPDKPAPISVSVIYTKNE